MKSVRMLSDFTYRPHRKQHQFYEAGAVYHRVPEAAVRAMAAAGAGEIVKSQETEND